jgi:hypothetical protein
LRNSNERCRRVPCHHRTARPERPVGRETGIESSDELAGQRAELLWSLRRAIRREVDFMTSLRQDL